MGKGASESTSKDPTTAVSGAAPAMSWLRGSEPALSQGPPQMGLQACKLGQKGSESNSVPLLLPPSADGPPTAILGKDRTQWAELKKLWSIENSGKLPG